MEGRSGGEEEGAKGQLVSVVIGFLLYNMSHPGFPGTMISHANLGKIHQLPNEAQLDPRCLRRAFPSQRDTEPEGSEGATELLAVVASRRL